MTMRWWSLVLGLTAVVATAAAQSAEDSESRTEPNASYDGRYGFVRLRHGAILPDQPEPCYTSIDGPGWHHDYPRADRNLMKIMAHLTSLDAQVDSSLVLYPDDPELMKYPIAYLAEAGCWQPSESEVQALRTYLLKGGFLIVDDLTFGMVPQNFSALHELARTTFEAHILRILPEGRLVPIQASDPIFNQFFTLNPLTVSPLVPLGPPPEFYGIYEDNDPMKRLLVVANYNLAIGHYWRWSREGINPVEPTNESYKLGVNYLLYGFVH